MPKQSKSDIKITRLRNTIIGFVTLVALALVIYGTVYTTGVTEGEYVEGTHFALVENPQPLRPGQPIEVVEFFSYGCIHCKNFDPLVEDWKKQMPAGSTFRRQPVAFNPIWQLLAQSFLALEAGNALEQNHSRFFNAIHERNKQFLSADMVGDFVDGNGISKEDFVRHFNSPKVRRRVAQLQQEQRQFAIASVPSLVVAGKYRINMEVGRKRALDIAEFLISKEQQPAG